MSVEGNLQEPKIKWRPTPSAYEKSNQTSFEKLTYQKMMMVMMVLVLVMYFLQLHRPQKEKKRTVHENTVEQVHNGQITQLCTYNTFAICMLVWIFLDQSTPSDPCLSVS